MVDGMEAIVATVSGYHGSQRLKLIQLITAVGANYVGKMSKSTTHLVCWKFKGEKYQLAKKIGTIVVNHRWLEDCMKHGKRIPEHPYTLVSGQDAGSLTSEISVVMEQAPVLKENKLLTNQRDIYDGIRNVIDLDSDDIENDERYDELLLDENLFPKPGNITSSRQKSKRKVVKKTSRGDWRAKIDNISSDNEIVLHIDDMFQSEDTLPSCSNKQRRRNADISMGTDICGSSSRNRRLVKKKTEISTTRLPTNGTDLQSKHNMNHTNDIVHLGDTSVQSVDKEDVDGRNLEEICSTYQKLEGQDERKDRADNFAGLQKSVELSCVICWTEHSSTRGVLPCGHRFCFSCIQEWADHMASNRKETTCPLCKASFASITRVDAAASLDQKSYSQTVPCASSQDIFIVPEAGAIHSRTQIALPSACCHCQSPYPAELLRYCQTCQTSCIHSYCLDPPLFPWTCIGCRDRRLFYHY
ncbi:hypothetical protein KSS87_020806 [Heliosperma pusillum]|nr:hypothetical protein KSS87_020806 [Heliosperma pusillum]